MGGWQKWTNTQKTWILAPEIGEKLVERTLAGGRGELYQRWKLCSVVGKVGWMAGPLRWWRITKISKYLEMHGLLNYMLQLHIDAWSPGQPDPGQGTRSHPCWMGTGGTSGSPPFPTPFPHPLLCQDCLHRPPGKPRRNTVITFIRFFFFFFSCIKYFTFSNISTSDSRWSFQGLVSTVWVVLKTHSVKS